LKTWNFTNSIRWKPRIHLMLTIWRYEVVFQCSLLKCIWTCNTRFNMVLTIVCSRGTSTDIMAARIIWCNGVPDLTCLLNCDWLIYPTWRVLVMEAG
jgi:hypothetical protein